MKESGLELNVITTDHFPGMLDSGTKHAWRVRGSSPMEPHSELHPESSAQTIYRHLTAVKMQRFAHASAESLRDKGFRFLCALCDAGDAEFYLLKKRLLGARSRRRGFIFAAQGAATTELARSLRSCSML